MKRNYSRAYHAHPSLSLLSSHPSLNTDCFLLSDVHYFIEQIQVGHHSLPHSSPPSSDWPVTQAIIVRAHQQMACTTIVLHLTMVPLLVQPQSSVQPDAIEDHQHHHHQKGECSAFITPNTILISSMNYFTE